MLTTGLLAIIAVLILVCVDMKRRLEKGKRGEEFLLSQVKSLIVATAEDHNHIVFLEDNLSLALAERDLFETQADKFSQQRADAWTMMEQILEEDLKDRKVPDNVSVQIGRDGVHYEFHFLPNEFTNATLPIESEHDEWLREQQSLPMAQPSV